MDHNNLDEHIHSLEQRAENLQNSGKYIECVKIMEEILNLKKTSLGENNEEYLKSVDKICELCNLIAMIFLQKENFDASLHFLKKAEILCQNSLTFRALTYNNMALFFRRTNKLKQALSFLQKALDIELQMETPQSLADTHLNMCAVLSQLNKHKEALQHVLISITLLQDEFLNLGNQEKNTEGNEKKEEEIPKGNIEDRVSVLAIAYHNLGVELEYLKRYQEAIQTYSKAVKFSIEYLGEKHQLVENLQKVLEAATSQIEAQKTKKPQTKEGKKEENVIQQKNFKIKKLYNPQSANQKSKIQTKEKTPTKNFQDENFSITKTSKNYDEQNKFDSKKDKGKDTRSDEESLM